MPKKWDTLCTEGFGTHAKTRGHIIKPQSLFCLEKLPLQAQSYEQLDNHKQLKISCTQKTKTKLAFRAF